MSKVKYFIEQSWLLIVSSFVFGLMIAAADSAWKPQIEKNQKEKISNLMRGLITDAASFEVVVPGVEITAQKGRVFKTDIYKAVGSDNQCAGFAFIASGSGFGGPIDLIIGVDSKCEKFVGYNILTCTETPGFGDKIKGPFFGDQFKGAPAAKLELSKVGNPQQIDNSIIAISGATVTSTAVVNIFNTYVDKVKEELQTKGLIGNGKQ
jgi:electron transport complex protein RnfG